MKKRMFVVTALTGIVATLATVAAVNGAVGRSALTPLPSSSCGPIQGPKDAQFLVSSDLPLQGAGRSQTVEMTKAINFVFKQHGNKAGKYSIAYQSCDDSTAQAGKWDSAKCSANAQAYAQNKSVISVIGTFNSGCAAIIIPILNRAPNGPVGMASPANTYVGLTHGGPGTAPGEPNKYYPTGKRNYIRMVAADDFQGAADAVLTKKLGVKSVYILNDKEAYGLGVATNFRNAAKKLGLKIAGFEAWDGKASSYEAIASKIAGTDATGIFLGGLICENGGKVIKDLRAKNPNAKLILPDGFTPVSAVVDGAGEAAENATVSVAGLPNSKLKGAGKKFLADFRKVIHKDADPYSVYAAQAAEVVLDAVSHSDGTRAGVAAQLFKTKVANGILGSFKIDKNGDTTSNPVTIYKIKGGKSTEYQVIIPPLSLVKAA